jgi:hypothetical protein
MIVYSYFCQFGHGLIHPNFLKFLGILLTPTITFDNYFSVFGESLVEKGSLVQDTKAICPGSVGKSGPMTGIDPSLCRLGAGPGSFRGIGPGLWHEPGPMPPQRDTWLSAEHWSRFMP